MSFKRKDIVREWCQCYIGHWGIFWDVWIRDVLGIY